MALTSVVVPLAGLLLHRCGLCKASVVVPLAGLLLHGNVLCRLSITGLWVHPQLLVKNGQLLVELALGLREFI
jgi:ABC-type iron transport system FetAB permease component